MSDYLIERSLTGCGMSWRKRICSTLTRKWTECGAWCFVSLAVVVGRWVWRVLGGGPYILIRV